MEIRAYAHPYASSHVGGVEALDDARLARQPVQRLYHMAADLDDHARALERDCATLWYGMEIRTELLALHASLGLYPERLAALREEQRIDRHNWALGVHLLHAATAQQARVQWALLQRDPCRYARYEG